MRSLTAALTPILVLILVGYGLKRAAVLPEDSLSGRERLTYFMRFPALLVGTLGNKLMAGVPRPGSWLAIPTRWLRS